MKNDEITYDPLVDVAYIRLGDSKIVDSESAFPGVIYDFDENGRVIGIEILSVKKRTPENIKELLNNLTDLIKQSGYKKIEYSPNLAGV